jgi:hypothetical protein
MPGHAHLGFVKRDEATFQDNNLLLQVMFNMSSLCAIKHLASRIDPSRLAMHAAPHP